MWYLIVKSTGRVLNKFASETDASLAAWDIATYNVESAIDAFDRENKLFNWLSENLLIINKAELEQKTHG